jgi:hypothetical protein
MAKGQKVAPGAIELAVHLLRTTKDSLEKVAKQSGLSRQTVNDINTGKHYSQQGKRIRLPAHGGHLDHPRRCSCGLLIVTKTCLRCKAEGKDG